MGNQFALVTGASSGIGLSMAKELANRGYDLAVCSAGERLHDAAGDQSNGRSDQSNIVGNQQIN